MTVNLVLPKNWKPKLIGLASAIVAAYQALDYKGDWQGAIHDHSVQTALLVAAGLWVVKQVNVTGGDVGQPSTAAALIASNSAPATGMNAPAGSLMTVTADSITSGTIMAGHSDLPLQPK